MVELRAQQLQISEDSWRGNKEKKKEKKSCRFSTKINFDNPPPPKKKSGKGLE